jgi:hypothetical protein
MVLSGDGIQEVCQYIGPVVEDYTIGVSKEAVKRRLFCGAEKQCLILYNVVSERYT